MPALSFKEDKRQLVYDRGISLIEGDVLKVW